MLSPRRKRGPRVGSAYLLWALHRAAPLGQREASRGGSAPTPNPGTTTNQALIYRLVQGPDEGKGGGKSVDKQNKLKSESRGPPPQGGDSRHSHTVTREYPPGRPQRPHGHSWEVMVGQGGGLTHTTSNSKCIADGRPQYASSLLLKNF